MPHIIVEYAEHCADADKITAILENIHSAISASGLFKAEQIRTRAYPFKTYTNAGEDVPYLHIQARIKSGRDDENKKQLGRVVLSVFEHSDIAADVVTVEIVDMHRESYGKYQIK